MVCCVSLQESTCLYDLVYKLMDTMHRSECGCGVYVDCTDTWCAVCCGSSGSLCLVNWHTIVPLVYASNCSDCSGAQILAVLVVSCCKRYVSSVATECVFTSEP